MSRGRNYSKKARNSSLKKDKAIESLDSIRTQIKAETAIKASSANPNTNLYVAFGLIAAIVISGSFLIAFSGVSNTPGTVPLDETESLSLIFQDLSGINFDLQQFKGKHIILDIMATWCSPCKEQIAILSAIKLDFPNVVIVSSSSDAGDTASKLLDYKDDNDMTWYVLRDVYGVSDKFSVTSIPTLIHITPDYSVKELEPGIQSYDTLAGWIS